MFDLVTNSSYMSQISGLKQMISFNHNNINCLEKIILIVEFSIIHVAYYPSLSGQSLKITAFLGMHEVLDISKIKVVLTFCFYVSLECLEILDLFIILLPQILCNTHIFDSSEYYIIILWTIISCLGFILIIFILKGCVTLLHDFYGMMPRK